MKYLNQILFITLSVFTVQLSSQWITVSSGGTKKLNSISAYTTFAYAVGDTGLVKKSAPGGSVWSVLPFNSTKNLNCVFAASLNDAYIAADSGMIYKTSNGGANWIAQTTGLTGINYYGMDFINAQTGMVVGSNGRAAFTVNGGTNWILAQLNVPNGAMLDYKVCDMIDINTWYVGSADTIISNYHYVYIHRTTNNGTSYQMIGQFLTLNQSNPYIYLRFFNPNTGYAATANGFFHYTTNGGSVWYSSPMPNNPSSVFFTSIQTGYYCSASGIIRKTTNGGINWIQQNSPSNLNLYSINCVDSLLCYAAGGNGAVIRTHNGGTYVNISQTSIKIPEQFTLYQNYPNPFNPITKISFDIPKQSFVQLAIYDILGKEVKVLLNDNISAGKYEADFDASELPSGVYFYRIAIHSDRLTSGEFTETKKMMLIK